MINIFRAFIICTLFSLLSTEVVIAQSDSTENSAPTFLDKLDEWSEEEFTFKGEITQRNRSHPTFNIKMHNANYNVLFDAGYKARKRLKKCLDQYYTCIVTGKSVMLFQRQSMNFNIIEISEITPPELDFKMLSKQLSNCLRNESHRANNPSAQATLGLEVKRIEPIEFVVKELENPPSADALKLVNDTLNNCLNRRVRLPVGEYIISMTTQNHTLMLQQSDN